jgi:hypothetical protein
MSEKLSTRSLLNQLESGLAKLKASIGLQNEAGVFEMNVFSETAVMKLCNLSWEWQLINSNLIARNYPAVDGVDAKNKLMAQVTSTFSNEKIEHTIDEVLRKRLYEKYPRLIFIFLKEKKSLSKGFRERLKSKIGNAFHFDPDKDCLDLDDIYNFHFKTQDIGRIHQAVDILEETYGFGPGRSGFDALSVCFHDEEIENVFTLVDAVIKRGTNVFTSSRKLFEKFKDASHPQQEFIVYFDEFPSFDKINSSIVVLSNALLYQMKAGHISCPLLNHAIANDTKMEMVSFDPAIRDYNKIATPKIRSYRPVNVHTIHQTIKEYLDSLLQARALVNISTEEIVKELIGTNSNFTASITIEDPKFTLLNLKMPNLPLEMNYLVLATGSSPSPIAEKIAALPVSPKNLIVLVPKDFDQKTRRRIIAVKAAFDTEQVYYVDEHLFDVTFKNLSRGPLLTADEFIFPMIRHGKDYVSIDGVIHWVLNNSNSSIALITGSGGIGKTTVCEKIHDMIVADNERVIVVFIDASKYVEVFRRRPATDGEEYDIFNIFSECHPFAKFIGRNSFYLNYSLGNLIIIFDGIDEVISTITSFSLHKFLESLESIRLRIGRGKIIINCRDNYVADLEKHFKTVANMQVYELLGFTDELARQFFNRTFNDPELVRSGLKLVQELYLEEENIYKYPPFILQVVNQIIESNFTYEEINMDFDSEILEKTHENDIVIYRICAREYAKKNKQGFQLDVDDQVRFLCEMAIEEKGSIDEMDFKKILENIGKTDRIGDVARGLYDHPLISRTNAHYTFRFDFFNTYFKSVAIFNMLCSPNAPRLTERLINILAFECNFNSVISKILIGKAYKSTVSFMACLKYSKELIENISKFSSDDNGANLNRKKRAISNMLVIILASKFPDYSNSFIIDYLFGDGERNIDKFYLIDVPNYAGIDFDFRDRYFHNTEIVNYGSFFNCQFDKDTFFDDTCLIADVLSSKIKIKQITADPKNFDKNIKGDNSIFKVMNIKNNENDVNKYFRTYFSSFFQGQHFTPEILIRHIRVPKDDLIDSELLTNVLCDRAILRKKSNEIACLDTRYRSKIIHFLQEGLLFPQLNRAISDLKNVLLSGTYEKKY